MAASAFKAIRILLGLLLVSGSYTTSALSVSQRQNLPTIWLEEKAITNDYDDDDVDDDDVVVAGQTVYGGGWGNGRTRVKIGAREPVEVEDEDFRYGYREPEADEEKRGAGGHVTKRKSKCVRCRCLSRHLLGEPRAVQSAEGICRFI